MEVVPKSGFSYIAVDGADVKRIEKKVVLNKSLTAPVKKEQKAGKVQYFLGEEKIGEVDLVTISEVPAMSFKSAVEDVLDSFSL